MARSWPGLKEVAAHAGVSIATVSRVINGAPYLTERVRERVLASLQALGYEPDLLAQSLRTGQTRTVGYVVSDISNYLFAAIARGIDDEQRQQGYTMLLANSGGEAPRDVAIVRHMQRRHVDGLILSLSDETSSALRDLLGRLSAPVVLLDREVDGIVADQVLVDHARGVAEALAHLHALGHRRIALITGEPLTRPGRAITAAFTQAGAELGLHAPRAHADRAAGRGVRARRA